MLAIRSGSEVFSVGQEIIYTNGMTTPNKDAEECRVIIESITGRPVELHHNDTTPGEKVGEIGIKVLFGVVCGVSAACVLLSKKKSTAENVLGIAFGVAAVAFLVWALKDYYDIQQKKNASANSLVQKVTHHLTTKPLTHVTLVFHSQGADIGERALWQLGDHKNRINVVVIGGMIHIPDSLARRVVNLQDGSDLISNFGHALFNVNHGEKRLITHDDGGCSTAFCHGANDYLSHPDVRKSLSKVVSDVQYLFDRSTQMVFLMN